MADSKLLFTPVEDMIVDNSWPAGTRRTPDNSLGKDAFLQLLITQMKYQDPLNPMDDRDFLGQMAQFTALEQMQNLNATFAKSQAYAMIGKTVEAMYRHPVTGEFEEVYGFVDAVTSKNGEVYLLVNGKEIPLSSVNVVGDDYLTSLQLNDILNNVSSTRASAYVGKYVQAVLRNDNNEPHEYIEGYVRYVDTSGSQPFLMVGNREVLLSEVTGVAESSNNHPFLVGKDVMVSGTSRKIEGVNIIAGRASLRFADGAAGVPVNDLKQIMGALSYKGGEMVHRDIRGIVESISIMPSGDPALNIRIADGSLASITYADYLDARGK
jgi:flagellar basal-body rod modification protein FlgD